MVSNYAFHFVDGRVVLREIGGPPPESVTLVQTEVRSLSEAQRVADAGDFAVKAMEFDRMEVRHPKSGGEWFVYLQRS